MLTVATSISVAVAPTEPAPCSVHWPATVCMADAPNRAKRHLSRLSRMVIHNSRSGYRTNCCNRRRCLCSRTLHGIGEYSANTVDPDRRDLCQYRADAHGAEAGYCSGAGWCVAGLQVPTEPAASILVAAAASCCALWWWLGQNRQSIWRPGSNLGSGYRDGADASDRPNWQSDDQLFGRTQAIDPDPPRIVVALPRCRLVWSRTSPETGIS